MSEALLPLSVTQSFTYDAYDRLWTAGEGSGWSQTYNYDAYGDRWVNPSSGFTLYAFTPQSSVYNSSNQFASTFQGSGYDSSGNLRTIGGYNYTYDAENRQTTVTINGVEDAYLYDGEGRRVEKVAGSTTTVYVYDATGQVASEYATSSPTTAQTEYLTQDPLGSTRLVASATGTVLGYHDYLPFGEEITGLDGRSSLWGASDSVTHKFTGQERDAETASSATQADDYFEARYLSGAMGRFTGPDEPLLDQTSADTKSWNLYGYVRNNPMKFSDPTGQDCIYTGTFNAGAMTVAVESGTCSSGGGTYVAGTIGSITYDANSNSLDYGYNAYEGNTASVGSTNLSGQEPGLTALKSAGTTIGPFADYLLEATMSFVMGPGMAALDAGPVATLGMLGGKPTPPGPDFEPSTPTGRKGQTEWNTAGSNYGTVVNGRFYTGHALDEMQAQGVTPSVVEDTIARGIISPGNKPGTWKYSTEQSSVVVNRLGNVVTVHLGGN
jgi:RHS repeat-associated protein